MSANANELPDIEAAVTTLDSVYCQRFLDKMAEYGYSPQTDAERLAMLQTAVQLDAVPAEQPSQALQSPYIYANEKLASVLGRHSVANVQQAAENDRAGIAQALASDTEFYKAAMAVLTADNS